MADQDVNKLKQAFDDVKAGLTTLKAGIQTLDRAIAADQYLTADMIALFSKTVDAYRTQAERLESLGAELSVPIGGSAADIEEAIRAFEDKQNSSQIRTLLLDYFRLTSDAARFSGALEKSKRALMEKCARSGDALADALAPYALAVDYARSDASSLPDDQFEVLVEAVGERVTLGINYHEIRYDETLDVTPYFDGSCALLMPEGGAPDKHPVSPDQIIEEAVEAIFAPKADKPAALDEPTDAAPAGKPDDNAAPEVPDESSVPDTPLDDGPLSGYSGFVAEADCKYVNNRPADELSSYKFNKLEQAKGTAIPEALRTLAEEKLYTPDQENRSMISRDTLNVLIAEGYVTTISIQSNLLSGAYYTLTDKGWACLSDSRIIQLLKGSVRRSEDYAHFKLPLPEPLITAPQDVYAFSAVCTALIHEFFIKVGQSALVFNRPDNPLAFGVSLAVPALLAVPAVFEAGGDLNTALDNLMALIGAHMPDRMLVLILARKEDAFILSKALDLDKYTGDIAFSAAEDGYSVYRLSGGALVPDETLAAPANAPAPDEVAPEDSADNAAAVDAAENTDTAAAEDPTDDSSSENAAEIAAPDSTEQKAAFTAALEKHGAFLAEEDKIGELSCSYSSDAEERKIASTIFISELSQSDAPAARPVIQAIAENTCISSGYITVRHPQYSEDAVSAALDFLCRKSYLRCYELPPFDKFYRASSRLEKALKFDEASRRVGVRQLKKKGLCDNFEETAECAAARIALLAIEKDALARFSEKSHSTPVFGKNNVDVAVTVHTGAHSCAVQLAKSKTSDYLEIMFCAMWRGAQECDVQECGALFEIVEDMVQKAESVDRMTIAAFTLDKAAALADSYFEASAQGGKCPVVMLYGLREGKYAAYRPAPEPEDGAPVRPEAENSVPAEESPLPEPAQPDVPEPIEPSGAGEEDALNSACKMLAGGRFYAAAAYLNACQTEQPALKNACNLLAYALNDPTARCVYQVNTVYPMVSTRSAFEDALIIAIAIRLFYSNQAGYDYFRVKAFYGSIKEYPVLSRFPALSRAVYSLMSFKSEQGKGMEAYAGYRLMNRAQLEEEIESLRREAQICYDTLVAGQIKESAQQRRFLETKKALFSKSGDLGFFIKAVADDQRSALPALADFLRAHFFKADAPIAPETMDDGMLWDYIVSYWEDAADSSPFGKHENLKSRLRSNITSCAKKVVELLAKWYALLSQADDVEDEAAEAYKKMRKPLETALNDAADEISAALSSAPLMESAALNVLLHTCREVLDCIGGAFSDKARLYFYAPFLLTDDVMLREDYSPDFDMHSTTLKAFTPAARILAHVRKVTNAPHTYRGRLKAIIDEGGDDFGAARLIMEYLDEMEHDPEAYSQADTLNASISYARNTAQLRRDDFVGELELAQSYGQIDNSEVNRTEIILQAVDNWYDWAVESCNFGFFKKVMDAYLADIRASCKLRATDLLARLEHFRQTSALSASPEARKARIQKITQAINEQKYTVAEDLLGRPIDASDDAENIVPEDFLKNFLDNYVDYSSGLNGSTFENLFSKRVRNKEERGALKLAQNWLPGTGGRIGCERLLALLDGLGIKDVAAAPDPLGKYDSYIVSATSEGRTRRHNYTHPIAAFGSGVWQDGFRVIWLNGVYTADRLIDVAKQSGNAYHTLILLDYALSLPERRHLAFRAKSELTDKMIGVIDRTVMMFLMRNYDETRILRMLMSLIAPFAYYQPYVWESANVMPPELFMGRKSELEKIKSVNGVNIVYGGRQLGKSALLKQARDAVEGNIVKDGSGAEYAERAVYIEIKGLDYQATARRISQELYDQGILPDDVNTTDWDELSRAVKRRLRQEGPDRIPYLLLLLDEADAFIESCEAVNYMPFDKLKEMQNVGAAHFKFVVAGLRNVVRFKREAALGRNSVLTHLQAMTVKPFSVSEARELLEVPLYYLGLRFPREKESLITLILATTNYFPGLIQMYCAKLLEAMRNKDYAGYSEADSPAYVVSVDHIKKVLADPEFTQQIWDKYFITLKLDEDDYYYVIALLMAYLYRENRSSTGYSIEDIKKTAAELDIRKIAALSNEKLDAFMEELIELNVLRKSDPEHYLFTRYTFFQMMMDKIDIEDELYKYMEA